MATTVEIAQEPRLISLSTPLGEDVLLLQSVQGYEELSRLFSYELEMLSERDDIAPADIVGKNVTFSVVLADGGRRHFNGFVRSFAGGSMHTRMLRRYRAEVVPWLWFLTRTTDCRIFQNKTVVEIIEQIFNDLEFSDFETSEVKGDHPKRVYCVQYRETDFNFVSRLMEEEGIFYWFRQEESKHTLVLADHKGAYEDLPESEIEYMAGSLTPDHITSFEHCYEFRTGKWAQTDYNFETPSTKLMTSTDTLLSLPSIDKYEFYDYPGGYPKKGEGEALTKLRMEEEEAPHDVIRCTSGCRTLHPGGKFTIKRHECSAEEGKTYVVTRIDHSMEDTTHTAGAAGDTAYSNGFTCIPDSVVFRPPRLTPKPFVQGPQTAVVVGPSGEEIYTDKHGRVKVQFHWDREGKNDENSSCWVRVSHPWAGKSWGAIAVPRIGQEVIVDFLEGDPDRPIIIGRVYNAEQTPPFGLPDSKVISGIKSNSTKGGGGYNEYVMDDTKGNELIREHGQYDKDSTIEHDLREHILNDRSRDVTNNETVSVGVDRSKSIGNNETTDVGNDRTETVGNNETITIGSNRTESVGANESIAVAQNRTRTVGQNETVTVNITRTHTVGANEMINVGAAQEVTIGGLQAVTVGAQRSLTVALNQDTSIGKDYSQNVGKNASQSVGQNRSSSIGKDDSLKVGKNLTIDAGDQVMIKTGKASILMKKDGTIQIEGKDITIKGSGGINVKASKNVVIKGKKVLEN